MTLDDDENSNSRDDLIGGSEEEEIQEGMEHREEDEKEDDAERPSSSHSSSTTENATQERRRKIRENQQRYRAKQRALVNSLLQHNAALRQKNLKIGLLNENLHELIPTQRGFQKKLHERIMKQYAKLFQPAASRNKDQQGVFFQQHFARNFKFQSEYFLSIPMFICDKSKHDVELFPTCESELHSLTMIDADANVFQLHFTCHIVLTESVLRDLCSDKKHQGLLKEKLQGHSLEYSGIQTAYFEEDHLLHHIHNHLDVLTGIDSLINDHKQSTELLEHCRLESLIGRSELFLHKVHRDKTITSTIKVQM